MRAFQGQYNFSNVNNIGLLLLTNRAIQGRQDQMIINNLIAVINKHDGNHVEARHCFCFHGGGMSLLHLMNKDHILSKLVVQDYGVC